MTLFPSAVVANPDLAAVASLSVLNAEETISHNKPPSSFIAGGVAANSGTAMAKILGDFLKYLVYDNI